MRLQKLTGLEREKVVEEYRGADGADRAPAGDPGLGPPGARRDPPRARGDPQAYGDPRRTEIIPDVHDITIEDMIADEDMVITVTNSGYIKRSPLSLYRSQRRGGKGRTGMITKDDDFVEHLYVASAHSYILVFTEQRAGLLAQGARDAADGTGLARQGDRQPAPARQE